MVTVTVVARITAVVGPMSGIAKYIFADIGLLPAGKGEQVGSTPIRELIATHGSRAYCHVR